MGFIFLLQVLEPVPAFHIDEGHDSEYDDFVPVGIVEKEIFEEINFDDELLFSDSDPDYVPDSAESDDEEYDVSPLKRNLIDLSQAVGNKTGSFENVSGIKKTCTVSKATDTETGRSVNVTGFVTTSVSEAGKEDRKKHYCFICNKPIVKLKRHFLTQHKSERELIPLLNASNSKKEKEEFEKLKCQGNHMHNLEVMRQGEGEMVVKRRKTSPNFNQQNFVPCVKCRGWYSKKDLWRHKCVAQGTGKDIPRRQVVKEGTLLVLKAQSSGNHIYNEIITSLRKDIVSLTAKNDMTIKMFGEKEALRNGHDRDRHNYIRNRLRELARLLIELRKLPNCESSCLQDFIRPERFKDIINAVKSVGKFESDSATFNTPSLAIKLGHSLIQCCILLKAQAIETNDEVLLERTEKYERLHTIKWNQEISTHATRTLYIQKKNTIKRIPLTDDVKKLSKFLSSESDNLIMQLGKDSFPQKVWERLSEVSLARIILFNRRRTGEASKMKLMEFTQGLESDIHNDDVLKELSTFEKALCKHLDRIEVIGKRGRVVPVLLTQSMKTALQCLIEKRNAAGVSKDNEYMFARANSGSLDHIRGCDCLRKLVSEADLQYPEKINSTGLRKHIATMTQLVNMQDNELDVLAQFLGHDIRTHRDYYRLPTSTTQVAKVAKLLISMEGNATEIPEDEDTDNDEEVLASVQDSQFDVENFTEGK